VRGDTHASTPASDRRAGLMRRGDLTPDERFERSARFWARAYPRRWREAHGDELLAVQQDVAQAVAEAAEAPLPTRLGASEIRALIVAGWGLRWREHPPLWRWVIYRLLDVRLPARYWWWVADDIHGVLYPWRAALSSMAFIAGLWFVPWLIVRFGFGSTNYFGIGGDPWAYLALLVVGLLAGFTFRKTRVRKAWRRHVMEGNMPLPLHAPAPLPPGVEILGRAGAPAGRQDAAPTS
jgi:hypothetical protein